MKMYEDDIYGREKERESERGSEPEGELMRYDPLLFSLLLGASRTYNAHV